MSDLKTSDLDYTLDARAIADHPAVPRDSAKLMVVHRRSGKVDHARVRDLPNWLRAGDHMVVNTTTVMRARFVGERAERSTAPARLTEGILLESRGHGEWLALVKHSKRFRPGERLVLEGHDGCRHGDELVLMAREEEGWLVRMESADGATPAVAVERSGWTPLPPYILRARFLRGAFADDNDDRTWYQTMFAHASSGVDGAGAGAGAGVGAAAAGADARPSVAAPTAGLHFTPELMARVAQLGVPTLHVNLQVGAGTFKSVEAETLSAHPMHREWCHVPGETLQAMRDLAAARARGEARLVVVGTTSVRTLESLPEPLPGGTASAGSGGAATDLPGGATPDGWSGDTRLLIQPGHEFRHVDALLTNFHLPRSTLLALVGAFVGLDRLKALYADAQAREYRFFSYGDAMLIV